MTTTIHRLLELQNRHPDMTEAGLSSTYMVVLNHLWNGRYSAASDAASTALADDPDDVNSPRMYRAWIEALSQLEDNASLADLATHLLQRGREEAELQQTFMALRGIIHVELDQAPAIRLISRALHGRVNNAYCLEFEQMCVRRGMSSFDTPIAHATGPINDYLVWNSLLQDLATEGRREELNDCLRHVNHTYPGSPAAEFFGMHLAFEHGHWQAAQGHAQRLHEKFPDHPDYSFHNAYAAFRGKDLEGAIRAIEGMNQELRTGDVDVLNLYGECLAERAFRDDNETDARTAIETLNFASKAMRRFGLEVDHTLSLIRDLEDHFGGTSASAPLANQFREPKSWMVILSPRRSDEIVHARDAQIEELHRPMGSEAGPGDVVLFVSRSAHTSKKPASSRQEWRLLAMYRVTSRPYWHPTNRWHSALELIDRPEHPVPIDSQEIKSDLDIRGKRASLPRGHHARFGVYSLDESAMDIMIAAVKRRSDGIDHGKERRGEHASKQKPV